MRLSIEEQTKLANIYETKVLVEMDVGGVVGGAPTSGGSLENVDGYAAGDNRIPKILGGIQTRRGLAKKKGKKKGKLARNLRPNKLL
jgi:hypothetical protein